MKITFSDDELDDFIKIFGIEGFKNMADDYESAIEVYKNDSIIYSFIPEIDPKTLSYAHIET